MYMQRMWAKYSVLNIEVYGKNSNLCIRRLRFIFGMGWNQNLSKFYSEIN